MSGSKGAVDMFGNQVHPVALDQVGCPVCRRHVAAGRFAPHLEKCMGKGRQASRAAARPTSEAERNF
jgi:SAGA-associated factor 11